MTRKVAVISLGGTIASITEHGSGLKPSIGIEKLLGAIDAHLPESVSIREVSLFQKASPNLSLRDVHRVYTAAKRETERGADGVVVVQGTDSLEEVAFALELLWDATIPLIFTGAMRGSDSPSPDGPLNLIHAIRAAGSATAPEGFVGAVFDGTIYPATSLRKTHVNTVPGFAAALWGPVGIVVEDRILWHREDRKPRLRVEPTPLDRTLTVPIVLACVDEPFTYLSPASRLDGLVVGGMGAGHTAAQAVETLSNMALTLPVVMSTRSPFGLPSTDTYGFPGSEDSWRDTALIHSGYLDPVKSRILLLLLLAGDAPRDAIQSAFMRYGGGIYGGSFTAST